MLFMFQTRVRKLTDRIPGLTNLATDNKTGNNSCWEWFLKVSDLLTHIVILSTTVGCFGDIDHKWCIIMPAFNIGSIAVHFLHFLEHLQLIYFAGPRVCDDSLHIATSTSCHRLVKANLNSSKLYLIPTCSGYLCNLDWIGCDQLQQGKKVGTPLIV